MLKRFLTAILVLAVACFTLFAVACDKGQGDDGKGNGTENGQENGSPVGGGDENELPPLPIN